MGNLRATQAVRDIAIESESALRGTQALRDIAIETTSRMRGTQALRDIVLWSYADGGEVPEGTNPPAGNLPSTTPQFYGVLETMDGDAVESVAERAGGPFNDDPDYGGRKAARVESFGEIALKSTTIAGGLQLTTQRILLNDEDGYYRGLWGSTTLRALKWNTFMIEHADRINKVADAPWRLNAGQVVDHGTEDDFKYSLTVEGMLGRHIGRAGREKLVPSSRITPLDIPELAARWADGWSPAIGYAHLDDEDAAKPQGVVPGEYIATANLQDVFGPSALNIVADFYVFFAHAVQATLNLYFTVPAWTKDTSYLVGDVIRPNLESNGFLYKATVAGTSGSSAPTFSLTPGATFSDGGVTWQNVATDDTELRYRVPPDAYNNVVADPHMLDWSPVTGTTNKYLDWNGFRFHVVLVRNDHRFAAALREGRMQLTGNFRGIEDVGDSTGALITDPARIFQHFWTNFVENTYKTGAWFPVPTFGTYSLFDTTTIEAVKTFNSTLVAGGPVKVQFLVGGRGQQVEVRDVVKEMTTSWDLKPFEGRHGQISMWIENPAAPAAVTLTAQHDAIAFSTRPTRHGYANAARFRYGPRYAPPVATKLTSEQGQPLPVRSVPEHSSWASGLQIMIHSGALAKNNNQLEFLDIDLWGVRDEATALVYVDRLLNRAVGPELEGPVTGTMTTGLQGLKQLSTEVRPGTVVGFTHPEGLGSSGYVNTRFVMHEVRALVEPKTPDVRVVVDGMMVFG